MKQIMDLEQLPNDFGKLNKEFMPYKYRIHGFFKSIHYYASIIGLMVAITPYLLSFLGVV